MWEGPPWAEPFRHTECRQGAGPGCRQVPSPKFRLSSRFLAVQEGPFPPLIQASVSNFTAACVHPREGLSSASQHWEMLLVPRPVGWHATCFVPHGLSKPCRGVDSALQGPEVQFLARFAQLFPSVVCKTCFPPALAIGMHCCCGCTHRDTQSLSSGKTACLAQGMNCHSFTF